MLSLTIPNTNEKYTNIMCEYNSNIVLCCTLHHSTLLLTLLHVNIINTNENLINTMCEYNSNIVLSFFSHFFMYLLYYTVMEYPLYGSKCTVPKVLNKTNFTWMTSSGFTPAVVRFGIVFNQFLGGISMVIWHMLECSNLKGLFRVRHLTFFISN